MPTTEEIAAIEQKAYFGDGGRASVQCCRCGDLSQKRMDFTPMAATSATFSYVCANCSYGSLHPVMTSHKLISLNGVPIQAPAKIEAPVRDLRLVELTCLVCGDTVTLELNSDEAAARHLPYSCRCVHPSEKSQHSVKVLA
jgi:hypothetical protein